MYKIHIWKSILIFYIIYVLIIYITNNFIFDELFYEFIQSRKGVPIISVTPTNYSLKSISIYAL